MTIGSIEGPELIFGLVGAVGTDLDLVCGSLTTSLSDVAYKREIIHLSQLLKEIPKRRGINLIEKPEEKRIDKYMNAGNKLRKMLRRGDALALLAVGAIREFRTDIAGDPKKQIPRQAFILKSLKHPDEVKTLRTIYGSCFILISAYAPREARIQKLTSKIAESHHRFQSNQYRKDAEYLIQRDEAEVDNEFGQNVRETFPLADVFINASDPEGLEMSIKRFIELLFSYLFHTPTRDEYAMFHAKAAALRSASLSRQVGAVISTPEGDIIAVGTNEVPKVGGGLYWCEDDPDHRDFTKGFDISDSMKKSLLAEVLERLQAGKWLSRNQSKKDIDTLIEEASMLGISPLMKGAQIMNIIEFGRAVHAEMAALSYAACRGVSVKGCTLYTTTFPCHECAKHIVASGIDRVVYIEPYPKSLVSELYLDSISIEGEESSGYVNFEPFVGISPRIYMELFSFDGKRKGKDGKVVKWHKYEALPKIKELPFVNQMREADELVSFKKQIKQKIIMN